MSKITISDIKFNKVGNATFFEGFKATGDAGGAETIICKATLDGISITDGFADIKGDVWTWDTSNGFSNAGTFVLTATDTANDQNSATYSVKLPEKS